MAHHMKVVYYYDPNMGHEKRQIGALGVSPRKGNEALGGNLEEFGAKLSKKRPTADEMKELMNQKYNFQRQCTQKCKNWVFSLRETDD